MPVLRRAKARILVVMKFQAERIEGTNAIQRHAPEGVIVGGMEHRSSVLVPWQGGVVAWRPAAFEELAAEDFEAVAALQPALVVFGSGARLRFPKPALLRPLMERRIGIETMDTAAACRTYNVLASEGRTVAAALLVETAG